jgi:hypothetical protein
MRVRHVSEGADTGCHDVYAPKKSEKRPLAELRPDLDSRAGDLMGRQAGAESEGKVYPGLRAAKVSGSPSTIA